MPRSSPSTNTTDRRVVEVVELDRDAPVSDELQPRPNRWAILAGIVLLAVFGLSLLPASEVEPDNANATLPDPAVATTLVGSSQPRLAFIGDERFPLFVVSGLKGFVRLTEPVRFGDRWWIVGNRPDLAAAVVLSSDDGRLWEVSSEIGAKDTDIRIDQLTTFEETLIAVGTEGASVGPDFFSTLSGSLSLWRSADGERWFPELIHPASSEEGFTDVHLTYSGNSVVVQSLAAPTAPARAALRLPAPLQPGLESGRFQLRSQGTRLVVLGPLGIHLGETALSQVSVRSAPRLFRSDSFGDWDEIHVQFNLNGSIVPAPEGGFVVGTGGAAFTSAYGVSWSPNARVYDADYFQDWGEGILGISWSDGAQTITLISAEGKQAVQLPPEMLRCSVEGSNGLLAAACVDSFAIPPEIVHWSGFEIGLNGPWLELRDPAIGDVRQFRLRAGGDYDPLTDTITLVDSSGESQAMPIEILRLFEVDPTNRRYQTMLSGDGLAWSRSQIGLHADEFVLLGGIDNGYLVATRSSEPGSTFTVLAGDF